MSIENMDWRKNGSYAICEYDNYFIPQSDPNTPEDEKKRVIEAADARLKELLEKSQKF